MTEMLLTAAEADVVARDIVERLRVAADMLTGQYDAGPAVVEAIAWAEHGAQRADPWDGDMKERFQGAYGILVQLLEHVPTAAADESVRAWVLDQFTHAGQLVTR